MFSQLKELYSLLTIDQRKKLIRLQILVVLMSFAEIAGVVSIGPFMALVGEISQLEGEGFLAEIYRGTGLESPRDFLFWLGIFIVLFLALATCISMFTIWRLSMYGAQVGAELANRLFRHYVQQPWLFHATGSSSQLTNRIAQEVQRITNQIINPLMQMNAKLVMALFMAVAVFLYNPAVAVSGLVIFSSAYWLLYKVVRRRLIWNGRSISEAQQMRFKLMGEGFGGIKDVLLLGRQDGFTNRFKTYALAGMKMLPAFQQAYAGLSQIRGNLAAFDTVRDDLRASSLESARAVAQSNERLVPQQEVRLSNVLFRYPGKEEPALNNIDMRIPANGVIGLVGASGSGKSTAIDLLLGLIEPQEGSLFIDGEPLTNEKRRAWQNTVGFVPQSIFLADSSIRENIAFGLPFDAIDEESVRRAAKMAHLDELLAELPRGLDTEVGERGVQLSGGQKQRIGIARALYNDADVLVLDEATSALDGITEKLIMDAIHDFSGKKTIIMIAHRLATVRQCETIYLLEKGELTDHGSYNDLALRSPIFRRMADNA